MADINQQRFYIELDTLLDTRLGALSLVYPGVAKRLLGEKWSNRTTDLISTLDDTVSDKKFQDVYKNRDVTVLAASRITGIYPALSDMMSDMVYSTAVLPGTWRVEVSVNVYPYILTDEERQDIAAFVAYHLMVPVEIKTIRIPVAQQTPRWLAENYDVAVLYNLFAWTDAHQAAIMERPYPRVTMIYPRLFMNKAMETNTELNEELKGLDVFQVLELELQTRMTLRNLPASSFSILS